MCLGVPGRITAIDGLGATADFLGVERAVRLDILDEAVAVGDYVLQQTGFAVRRLEVDEALESLELFRVILAEVDAGPAPPPAPGDRHP